MAALVRVAVLFALAIGLMVPSALALAQNNATHLGVASCSGSNCHGATERPRGSYVPGNEYIIWSTRDKHRQAYTVLQGERAVRMARALGYPDAVNQKICLDCHADNVPPEQRGRQFQLSDGVGCEACHGGAQNWLGTHISGATHRDNLASGLYPTELPLARAEKCLSCHFGNSTKFVDHRLIGAGHPRLPFELDTFTSTEPAHYVVDRGYVERKGRVTDLQVWATGQAVALYRRMDALLDPRHGRRGMFPEFALFDCQGCHHPYDLLHAPLPTATGLGPGTAKLNDANAVMLETAAARLAPGAAAAVSAHLAALQRTTEIDPAAMPREAQALRQVARSLANEAAIHEYSPAEIRALADSVIAVGSGPDEWRFAHAEQTTMALEAIVAQLRSSGQLDPRQDGAVKKALDDLFASFANEASFRSDSFAAALREFQRALHG